ncbi:hypothetical protein OBV_18880 [Oscillibacter valericigenes Sjm18-20]|nr:hypothetical protein OBV_18880 [Oscillibacter valericigenes Sjm18-20]
MTECFDRILRKYGQTVKVNDGVTRAFFQPAREKEKAAPFAVSSLGTVDDRRWTYLGRTQLELGDHLEFQGQTYAVNSCESVRLGDEPVYWWASLTAEREAEE